MTKSETRTLTSENAYALTVMAITTTQEMIGQSACA